MRSQFYSSNDISITEIQKAKIGEIHSKILTEPANRSIAIKESLSDIEEMFNSPMMYVKENFFFEKAEIHINNSIDIQLKREKEIKNEIRILVTQGHNLNQHDEFGFCLLHMAVNRRNAILTKFLLTKNIDVKIRTKTETYDHSGTKIGENTALDDVIFSMRDEYQDSQNSKDLRQIFLDLMSSGAAINEAEHIDKLDPPSKSDITTYENKNLAKSRPLKEIYSEICVKELPNIIRQFQVKSSLGQIPVIVMKELLFAIGIDENQNTNENMIRAKYKVIYNNSDIIIKKFEEEIRKTMSFSVKDSKKDLQNNLLICEDSGNISEIKTPNLPSFTRNSYEISKN